MRACAPGIVNDKSEKCARPPTKVTASFQVRHHRFRIILVLASRSGTESVDIFLSVRIRELASVDTKRTVQLNLSKKTLVPRWNLSLCSERNLARHRRARRADEKTKKILDTAAARSQPQFSPTFPGRFEEPAMLPSATMVVRPKWPSTRFR